MCIRDSGQTILMVTHSVRAASVADRVLFIKDGVVGSELSRAGERSDRFYQRITEARAALETGGDRA